MPGEDRIEVFIDRETKTIKLCKVTHGGYKLLGGASSRPHVKFTVAKGMPIAETPAEADDVIVIGGEIMFMLPSDVRVSAN